VAVIHTIDNNRITARNMLVEGDIHITCNLSLVDYPTTTEIIKECQVLAETITITGDLYIKSDNVNCQNAVVHANLEDYKSWSKKSNDDKLIDYDDLIIEKSETFNQNMNISFNNVYLDAGEVRLYGRMVSEGQIIVHSDKVFTAMRSVKINKIKSNIKK